jgi:hypothetical protein
MTTNAVPSRPARAVAPVAAWLAAHLQALESGRLTLGQIP